MPTQGSRRKAPNVAARAQFVGVFGASGSGKSHFLKTALRADKSPRVLVFDPGHEYIDAMPFDDELKLWNWVNASKTFKCALRPSFDQSKRARQFDRFCAAVLAVARSRGSCAALVDELHLVTDNARPPAHWLELNQTGRKFNVSLYAASIRPAAVDKHFWTNLTYVRTGRLNFEDDQKTLANVLGVKVAEVANLTDHGFIARDMLTGKRFSG